MSQSAISKRKICGPNLISDLLFNGPYHEELEQQTLLLFFFIKQHALFRRVYTPTRDMVTTKEKANFATGSASPLAFWEMKVQEITSK